MASDTTGKGPLSEAELQELLSSSDGGARDPAGAVGLLIAGVALAWSVFQVVLASPVSNYVLPGALINNSRQFHLAFAIFLAFMAYPMLRSSPRSYVPVYDWVLAVAGAFIALYGYFFYDKIEDTLKAAGCPISEDKWFTNLSTRGNTGSASIYLMLEEAFNEGKLKEGDGILAFIPESGRFAISLAKFTVVGPS